MTQIRLNKFLASCGVDSRRNCDQLVFDGKVKINGLTVLTPGTQVKAETDKVSVNGQLLSPFLEKVYFLLNKPTGYLCSNKRVGKQKLAVDLFPEHFGRLFTVGRLDKDTSGLLIVTNDGDFAQNVIHPSKNIPKEYLVKCKHETDEEHLKVLAGGIYFEGKKIIPLSVTKMRKGTFKITIKEGKKHEVRLLCENAKIKIWQLKRIRIGNLTLGPLKEGAFRPLSTKEKNLFL